MKIGKFEGSIKFRHQSKTGNCLMPKTHCSSQAKETYEDTSGQMVSVFSCVNMNPRVTPIEGCPLGIIIKVLDNVDQLYPLQVKINNAFPLL